GWYYWYGHIKNPTVSNGDKVKAGDKLAVIGQSACADDTDPHLHIDRGTPKGEYGGSECCRDPDFVPLLDKIYEDSTRGGGRRS
ncbi:MAG: M23 family metallopeptidase, partial [Candidatus Saccharimonadales bacterium]